MVEKLKKIIRQVETDMGGIVLFMLWKDAPEIDKWAVVISAAWVNTMSQHSALDYWIKILQKNLDQQELFSISRISFLRTDDVFVQMMVNNLHISGGSVRFTRSQVGNYFINDAIIFEAKPIVANILVFSRRNPLVNGSINPNINGSINPTINGSINPNINGSINPTINGSINPNINGSINPTINGSINPNINGSINPTINGSINPNINGSINPILNPNFQGHILFDLNLNKSAFFIKANENILSMFDFSNQYVGFCVKTSKETFNVFDLSSMWIGFLIPNKKGGYNYFDINRNWIGFVI